MFAMKMVIRKAMRLRVKRGCSKVQYQTRHRQSLTLSTQLGISLRTWHFSPPQQKIKTYLPLQARRVVARPTQHSILFGHKDIQRRPLAHAGGGSHGEIFGPVDVEGEVVEKVLDGARDGEPAVGLGRLDGGRHCL